MKKPLIITILPVLAAILVSCGVSDKPPSYDTPSPPPLDGEFVSEYGSMTFEGDGRKMILDTTEEFEKLTGIPAGKHEGQYVFLYHNGEWRYDKAEDFRIMLDGESYQFPNEFGQTDEDTVAFRCDGGTMVFEKTVPEESSVE